MKSVSVMMQYHQLTKYKFENVQYLYKDFVLRPQPAAVKTFPDALKIELPGNYPPGEMKYSEVRRLTPSMNKLGSFQNDALVLLKFSEILYATFGATLFREFATKKVYFRAAPSGGGLYPTDLYVVVNNVTDLENGIYYFEPEKHQLIKLESGNYAAKIKETCFGLDSFESAAFSMIFVTNIERNYQKYENRALRYALLDAGYVAENLSLAAANSGKTVNFIGDFNDKKISELLKLDENSEFPLLIAAVGKTAGSELKHKYVFSKPDTSSLELFNDYKLSDVNLQMCHGDAGVNKMDISVEFPVKMANSLSAGQPENSHSADTPVSEELSFLQTIERRRSAHHFVNAPVSRQQIEYIVKQTGYSAAIYGKPLFKAYLAVNSVDGLQPGIYKCEAKYGNLNLLKTGFFRGNLTYLSVAQDVVYKSAAMLLFAIDFDALAEFSERGYRYAMMNIGMVSENVYLAANSVGLGARGIATFFDQEFNDFLELKSPNQNLAAGVIIGQI